VKSKIFKGLQFIFFLLLGGGLLYFAFRGIDLNDMILEIRNANYSWVALSLFFATLALVFRTIRWRLLIEPLGEFPKRANIFYAINIGYLANFVFPRIGEIVRCGILKRTDNTPVDRLFGTVITERVFDLLMSIALLCIMLILRFEVVSSFIVENIVLKIIERTNIVILFVIFSAITLIFFILFVIFKKQLSSIKALNKIKTLLQGIFEGVKSIKHIRNFNFFIFLSFLIFGMYFLQTYVLFFALESASSLGLGDALFVLVISTFALVLPVQGGIGAFHWVVSLGLTLLGLTREEGLVYATISHSASFILFIVLGVISLLIVFAAKTNKIVK